MERRRTGVSDLDTTRPIERVRPAEPEEAFEPMEATQIMPAPEREFTKVAATAAQRPSVTPEPPVPPEPIREEVVKPYEAPASELTGRFNKVSDTEATATAAGLAGASAAAATTAATAGTVAGAAVVPPTSEALAGDDDHADYAGYSTADDATALSRLLKPIRRQQHLRPLHRWLMRRRLKSVPMM